MKMNRFLALVLIAALVIGAMGLLTYRTYAQGRFSGSSSECVEDDDAAETGESDDAEDGAECAEDDALEDEAGMDDDEETEDDDADEAEQE